MHRIWTIALLLCISCGDDGGPMSPDAGPDTGQDASPGGDAAPGPDAAPVGGWADEFDQPMDLLSGNASAWSLLGDPASAVHDSPRLTTADIDTTRPGWLVLIPQDGHHYAWYQDDWGPLLYRTVTGNFAVVTRLRVVCEAQTPDADCRPAPGFNAGGFVFRDPAGTENGDENWVMYNMGGQGPGGYAREIKKTVDSTSSLFLNPQADVTEYLLGCRVGSAFYFFYWDDIDGDWREEQFHNDSTLHGTPISTQIGGAGFGPVISAFSDPGPGNSTAMWFDHAAMPQTLQVGLVSHNWDDNVLQDTRSEFDFVRFGDRAPTSRAECLDAFPGLGAN